LDRANRRLSGQESYTVAPSRYLGHYVAGNLATRFGISVRLQDSPAGGVTATVAVPASLLASAADQPPEVEPPEVEPPDHTADDMAAAPEAGLATSGTRAPESVVEADVIDAPRSLAEALGTSELASIGSVQDLTSAIDGGPSAEVHDEPDPPAPPGALPRRVPGAQRPDLQPTIARRVQDAVPAPETPGTPATDEGSATAPVAGAFGFFAGYSAAANGSTDDGSTDDGPSDDGLADDELVDDSAIVSEPGAHLDHSSSDDLGDERDASIQEDR
ncbi:MAG: hypothetical protein ACSLFO_15420, partial [Acidimicrobiales bacterium]